MVDLDVPSTRCQYLVGLLFCCQSMMTPPVHQLNCPQYLLGWTPKAALNGLLYVNVTAHSLMDFKFCR